MAQVAVNRMPVCPKCNTVYVDELRFCKADGASLIPHASETHIPLGVVVNESLRVVDRLRTDRFGVVYRVEDAIDPGEVFALRLFRRGLVNSKVFAALGQLAERLRQGLLEPDVLGDYIPIQLEDGRYALLSADFPGVPLDGVITSEAPLKPPFVVSTLLRVADVLTGAHSAGFVHGNITPENVLVVDRSERGVTVKLADFGLATTIRLHNARALTAPAGSVRLQNYDNYFAPEIVTGRGVEADDRTDIFSLGALCYQMLSGWIPFSDASIEGDIAVYLTEDPRPLMVLNKELGIPRALEQAMLTALELNPNARHRSIADLIEVLQEIELDLSIMPEPGAEPRRRSSRLIEASRIIMDSMDPAAPVPTRVTDPLDGRDTGATEAQTDEADDDEPDATRPSGD